VIVTRKLRSRAHGHGFLQAEQGLVLGEVAGAF